MHCCSRSVATEAYRALLATQLVWLAACTGSGSDRQIEVQGTDYAFTVPDTIAPGRATLKFTNSGRVRHELVLARLKPGVTLADVMRAQQEGKSPDDFLIGVSILFANAGETNPIGFSVDFKDGERYSMVCFIRDSANAPPHVALGMMKEVVVAAR